jgi:hypothetical protein
MTEIQKFWLDFQRKLQTEGGLPGAVLDSVSAKTKFGCDGITPNGNRFHLTLADSFAILHLLQHDQELFDALIKVIGYTPFCRYIQEDEIYIEWSKEPEKCFAVLQKHAKQNLERICDFAKKEEALC